MVDSKRIWLMSGSVHYFRTPAALWPDRLLKAKRAGLNCIDTYVAWNFHEQQEGKWDFSGDRDVAAFVRQAGKMGLYVILRPGPYICAEWDCGGLPGWLTAKSGVALRTNNATYSHYFDKYFRQVLPRLADLQVTHGGNIILIQNENEYYMTTMPDRLAHLEFINQLFRRAGFDIPIINCNLQTDPPTPDNIECFNGWDKAVVGLKKLRLRQPNAPMLVTEFWDGWFDRWGGEHSKRDDREAARRAMEILGCGSQINYYMWHGGTNFGFWGSRLAAHDWSYQTTSYDYDAPLAECGGLTRKYYLTRLVNMLANHMGRFLAPCTMGAPGGTVHDATSVYNLSGAGSNWCFVSNGGRDEIKSVRLSLANGVDLTVPLEPFGAAAAPSALKLTEEQTLDYSSVTPLGFFHDKTLVLHGPANWEAVFRINGKTYSAAIPAGEEVKLITIEPLTVVLVNSELAMRTWLVEDTLVFGPAFAGATLEDLTHLPHAKEYTLLPSDGKLQRKKVAKTAAAKVSIPRLSPWKLLHACGEIHNPQLQWQKMDRPRDVDSLGLHYGYVWYRAEIQSRRAAKRHLFLPECEDRATIYHNGKPLAIWGRGPGATRLPIRANFVRGANTLTVLLDNLGRVCGGPNLGELKGIHGHIFDAKPLKMGKIKLKLQETFPRRVVPRKCVHLMENLESQPVWLAQMDVSLSQIVPLYLTYTNVWHHLAVLCNDRLVDFVPRTSGYGDVTMGSELQKGRNRVDLLIWGDVTPELLEKFRFYCLAENLTADAKWGYRPWTPPESSGPHSGGGKKPCPSWYSAHFKRPSTDQPLFLRIGGSGKGQLYLNRHNIGRYWPIGPQELYYLPSCWLADDNQLMVFDETGSPPAKCGLEIHPAGPYR